MFQSILANTQGSLAVTDALILLFISVLAGFLVALTAMLTGCCSKQFAVSLVVLPAIVQTVIMMVNGNLGVGVAVLGAFSLIRFRSVPGSSREIILIFLAMAAGLINGMGFWTYSLLCTALVSGIVLILWKTPFGERPLREKTLKITVPEDLDYTGIFDGILETYTRAASLESVKTTNMGSMFELRYFVVLKDPNKEKEMLDALRCRNGNLTIVCVKAAPNHDEL